MYSVLVMGSNWGVIVLKLDFTKSYFLHLKYNFIFVISPITCYLFIIGKLGDFKQFNFLHLVRFQV